jgi:hypothetical protein
MLAREMREGRALGSAGAFASAVPDPVVAGAPPGTSSAGHPKCQRATNAQKRGCVTMALDLNICECSKGLANAYLSGVRILFRVSCKPA